MCRRNIQREIGFALKNNSGAARLKLKLREYDTAHTQEFSGG